MLSRYLMTNRAFNSWRSILTHLSLSAPDNIQLTTNNKYLTKFIDKGIMKSYRDTVDPGGTKDISVTT